MSEPIISVSGLRGVIGRTLTPDVATRYVAAYVTQLGPGPIVVGRDGRSSGQMLAAAVVAGLTAAGRSVFDLGVAATPTVGVQVRQQSAAGGVQITASHNPSEYNGLKLFSDEGRVIPAPQGEQVVQAFRSGEIGWVGHAGVGSVAQAEDAAAAHLEAVLQTVDVERIRRSKYRVLLDSNHGSGAELGERLLVALGCDVKVMGREPNGQFAHPPEPTAENLRGVLDDVRSWGADIGFCQDPDADRLAIVDGSGRYLGEECTLALCVDHVLRQGPGPIVTNCASSRMSEDLAEKYGVPFHRSAVGEANVVDLMRTVGAVFGGEGNGGPIDPRIGWVRDSFVGMAQVLDAMAAAGRSVAQLAAELPSYAIHKTVIPLPTDRVPAAVAALQRRFSEATVSHMDGLRLDFPDAWLLVRASNTEPLVRAIAEAATATDAEALCAEALNVINSES